MSEAKIKKPLDNTVYSLEVEVFYITEKTKELCKRLAKKEITLEEYIKIVKRIFGVSA